MQGYQVGFPFPVAGNQDASGKRKTGNGFSALGDIISVVARIAIEGCGSSPGTVAEIPAFGDIGSGGCERILSFLLQAEGLAVCHKLPRTLGFKKRQ
jgi:hypothetical protein